MRPEIRQILDIIDKDTKEHVRQDGITQLVYILEISNGHSVDPYHHDELTEEQLKIRLSVDEQHEIVRELLKIIDKGHSQSSSLIFTIGKAAPEVIIDLFQDFFLTNYVQMDNELIYQSIIALQDGMFTEDREVLSKLKFAELKTMFETLFPSSDERIAEQARASLRIIERKRNLVGG